MLSFFLNLWLKLFFVFTPFFALSIFLSLTEDYDVVQRRKTVFGITATVALVCLLLFFAGRQIFALLGITLDAFRVGAGALLFLSGIGMARGNSVYAAGEDQKDVAVVPMAVPVIVGPATIGVLLVMGADLLTWQASFIGTLALLSAVVSMGAILFASALIARWLGKRGITIISKLTGIVLVALAAQIMMKGVQGFFNL